MTVHGGDVYEVASGLGIPADTLLDFSANVNPRGLPARAGERLKRDAADARLLGAYSDPSARSLKAALALPHESVAIGAGAEALLGPILRTLGSRRALVPVPAFSEYRRVCAMESVEFVPFPLEASEGFRLCLNRFRQAVLTTRCDTVFLNNPHNPSGAILTANQMRAVVQMATAAGAMVLLDEAFIDFAPEETVTLDAIAHKGMIVLRSLTKFFGCPALRVGYAVAHPETIRRLNDFLATWPVTQLALNSLAEALEDRDYAEASLRENSESREELRFKLQSLGLTVFPSSANYLLVQLPDHITSSDLRLRLIQQHRILIRNCDSYEGLAAGRFVRVAVKFRAQNDILLAALAHEMRQK